MFRRLVVVGAGAALLAGLTAGPLSAASSNKIYSAAINPATVAYSGSSSVQATFTLTYTNLTPSASINSLTLTAPSGYTINSLATPAVTESSGNAGNYSATLNSTGTTVTVTNLYPVGYLGTVSVSFMATDSSLGCNNVGTWTTAAWTGSNLGGNQFTLSGAAPTTTIGTSLQPVGQAGSSITVNGATVTNIGNGCAFVGVSRSGNNVTVLKPANTSVNLKVEVYWNPEPAVSPLPWTQVNAPASANDSTTGTHNIQWCGSDGQTPPGSEVSCLNSESSQLVAGTSTVKVHDIMYLVGDWSALR